jgi:phasin family protein
MTDTMEALKTSTTTAMKDGYEKFQAAMGDVSTHGKANLEAVMASTQTVGKGLEEVAALTTAYSKTAFEKGAEAFKTLAAAKSLQEIVEVQADYAKTSMEAFFAQFNKVNDVMVNVAKEAAKPLSDRTAALVEAMQAAK